MFTSEELEINVTRSVVKQRIGPCKTEASRKPVPLDAELAQALWKWKSETFYNQPHDWVFASPHTNGKQPYWPGSLYRAHLEPACTIRRWPILLTALRSCCVKDWGRAVREPN